MILINTARHPVHINDKCAVKNPTILPSTESTKSVAMLHGPSAQMIQRKTQEIYQLGETTTTILFSLQLSNNAIRNSDIPAVERSGTLSVAFCSSHQPPSTVLFRSRFSSSIQRYSRAAVYTSYSIREDSCVIVLDQCGQFTTTTISTIALTKQQSPIGTCHHS